MTKLTPVQEENAPFKSRLSKAAGHSFLDPRDHRANQYTTMAEALQIVLDLAKQNVCDIADNPQEHARQMEAIDTVEDFAVNQFGD